VRKANEKGFERLYVFVSFTEDVRTTLNVKAGKTIVS